MGNIPGKLIEASNGIIMILLLYFLVFLSLHMIWQYREARNSYYGRWAIIKTLLSIRRKCGAEIALGTIMVGFEIRTAILWTARHFGEATSSVVSVLTYGPLLLLFGTFMVILGAICWNRVMVPFRCSGWLWVGMAVSAIGFGVFMAL